MRLRYGFVNGTWASVDIGDQPLDEAIPAGLDRALIVKDGKGDFALLVVPRNLTAISVEPTIEG